MVVSSTNAPSGAATSQSAIDLNVSESRDLSLSLGTEPYRLCSNHPFDGWFVIVLNVFSLHADESNNMIKILSQKQYTKVKDQFISKNFTYNCIGEAAYFGMSILNLN